MFKFFKRFLERLRSKGSCAWACVFSEKQVIYWEKACDLWTASCARKRKAGLFWDAHYLWGLNTMRYWIWLKNWKIPPTESRWMYLGKFCLQMWSQRCKSSCHRMPHYAIGCHRMPQDARWCLMMWHRKALWNWIFEWYFVLKSLWGLLMVGY